MGLLRFLSRRRPGKGVRLENGPDHLKPPKGHVDCKVQLLDGTDMTVFVPKKALAQELYDQVYYSLDLIEKDYFGLQFSDTHQVKHWLDPTKTIKKQMKIGPPYTLRFRVKFYSLEPQNLREEYTRYQFYLQLKQDILTGRLECPFDVAVELSAYILQSDLGDYDPEVHTSEFISEYRFVPEEVQTEEMEVAILDTYKKLKGQTPAQVEQNFLRKVKWLEKYGQDLHIAYGRDGNEYQLGLNPHGILVVEGNTKIGHFFWHKTEKIHFNKKKIVFVVLEDDEQGRANEHTFPFWMRNKKAAKHLWKCAVEHHTFFRLNGPPQEPSVGSRLFRMNSRFRYSGRTESQTANEIRPRRAAPQFERRPSQRFSRRASTRGRPQFTSGQVGGNPETVPPAPVPASASTSGTAEVLEFKPISPAPVLTSAVPVSPKPAAPLPFYTRQPSVANSSCEVLATSYFIMPADNPPPVPPRSSETKRSPSLTDLANREEPSKAPRTPVQPVSFFPESTDSTRSPLSPPKPARLLQNPLPVHYITEKAVPLESNNKSSSFRTISEDNSAEIQRRPQPEVPPTTPVTPAAPSNGFSYIAAPREIIGSDTSKPKDSAPKELVSILKKDVQPSDLYLSKLVNGLRDASNDSGRASPPSSPSVSPSRTSSALSAVSKAESNRLSVEICDTMPLLHDSDVEHEHEEPTPTMLSLPEPEVAAEKTGTAEFENENLINAVEIEGDSNACSADKIASLEIADHDEHPLLDFACEPSISVSRSGSGASTGSTGTEKYTPPSTNSNMLFSQIKPWMLPETKPYNISQSSNTTMQPRRVITTEL